MWGPNHLVSSAPLVPPPCRAPPVPPSLQAKGNRDKQSLIPTTIKQLKNAPGASAGEASFTIDGHDLYQVTIVGLITQAEEQATNLQYTIDDGTGTIMIKMWIDADANESFDERRAGWKEGAVVRVPMSLLASLSDTMTPQGVLAVLPPLLASKTATLPLLLHMAPAGTPAPTPLLYNGAFYALGTTAALACTCNLVAVAVMARPHVIVQGDSK